MDHLCTLPSPALLSIFQYLNYNEKMTIRQLCSRFRSELNQKTAWKDCRSITVIKPINDQTQCYFNGHLYEDSAIKFHFEFCWLRFVNLNFLKIAISSSNSDSFALPDCVFDVNRPAPAINKLVMDRFPQNEQLVKRLQGSLTSFTFRHREGHQQFKNHHERLMPVLASCHLTELLMFQKIEPTALINLVNQLPSESFIHLGISPSSGNYLESLFQNQEVQFHAEAVGNIQSLTIGIYRSFDTEQHYLASVLTTLPSLKLIDIDYLDSNRVLQPWVIMVLVNQLLKDRLGKRPIGLCLRVPFVITDIQEMNRQFNLQSEFLVILGVSGSNLDNENDLIEYKLARFDHRDSWIRLILKTP